MRFFSTFTGAFYSPTTYRTVRASAGHGLGYTFFYLLIETFVLISLGLLLVHGALFTGHDGKPALFDDVVMQIAEQTPRMTLHNNRLVTEKPQAYPIIVHAELFGKPMSGTLALIDTTGATTYDTMTTPILITADGAAFRDEEKHETRVQSFRDMNDKKDSTAPILITRESAREMARAGIAAVHHYLPMVYLGLGTFGWAVVLGIAYLLRICLLVPLAVGGLLLGKALRSPVNFATSMRLAAVSFTPVSLLDTLLHGTSLSTWRLLALGLLMLGAALIVTRETTLEART